MQAVVKLKRHELGKENNRSCHSRPELSATREDISTSENLSTVPEISTSQMSECFSFIKMPSSCHSPSGDKATDHVSELNPHSLMAKFCTHHQPHLPCHSTFENTNHCPRSQSVTSTVHLSHSTCGPLFFLPHLCGCLSSCPLLPLSVDDSVNSEKCLEFDSSEQKKGTEECRSVVRSSHKSPLLVNEQDIVNLAKHQRELWSLSNKICRDCWTGVTSTCKKEGLVNDGMSCTSEQVKVTSANELLKETPVDDDTNINSDNDGKVLQQVVKLLTTPKRSITTQVDLVGDVLQGSEHLAPENQAENMYADLVSAIQRIMLHLSKN